ncbi:hypothetical protein ACFL34_01060 [Candidatus Sumerlaeota bacterium]
MGCEIRRRQTTYWEVLRDDGRLERIHFLGKEEFSFAEPGAPSVSIVEEHAVLDDYLFSWESIYLASPADTPEQCLGDLTQAIEGRVAGWRSATDYFNAFGAERILRKGYGQLLSAPMPIAEISRAVLAAAGVRFSSLPGRPSRWPRQAFIAGLNYVVAQ